MQNNHNSGPEYLCYASHIGNLILKKIRDSDELSREFKDIYRGKAGLILFFIELYKQTRKEKYLEFIISESEVFLKDDFQKLTNYSYYRGRLGIACTFIKIGTLLEDERFFMKALFLTENCSPNNVETNRHVNDLLEGVPGIILALLHLHRFFQKEWILDHIYIWVERLISKLHLSKQGIYFDRSPLQESGLCGFSHGGSGVGFVFLELGHYFKNEAFYFLADLTFSHENPYYEVKRKNWRDLRYLESNTKILLRQFESGNLLRPQDAPDNSLWCNGAPGISLAALRAFELTNDPKYKKVLLNSITNTRKSLSILKKYPLCHGLAGNAYILYESFSVIKDDQLQNEIYKVSDGFTQLKIDNLFKKSKFNPINSLFLGPAGVGYFLLALSSRQKIDSVIFPTVSGSYAGTHSSLSTISESELSLKILEVIYPKTIHFVRSHCNGIKIESAGKTFRKYFNQSLKRIVSSLNEKRIDELFIYERLIERQRYGHDNNHFLYIIDTIDRKRARKLLRSNLSEVPLVLSTKVQLIKTKWNWNNNSDWIMNMEMPIDEYFTLSLRTPMGSEEFQISHFTYLVLESFRRPGHIQAKMKNMHLFRDIHSDSEKRLIKSIIVKQVREAIKKSLIVEYNG